MYKEEELKLALSTKTGITRKIGPNIWRNPFRMRSGGWKIIEQPAATPVNPVLINLPKEQPSPPPTEPQFTTTITDVDSYEIPEVVTVDAPEQNPSNPNLPVNDNRPKRN